MINYNFLDSIVKKRKYILVLALSIIYNFLIPSAHAGSPVPPVCSRTGGVVRFFNQTIPSVSPDLKIGESITGDITYPELVYAKCTTKVDDNFYFPTAIFYGPTTLVGFYNGRSTFATNIRGVGVQVGGIFEVESGVKSERKDAGWIVDGDSGRLVEFLDMSFTSAGAGDPTVLYKFIPEINLVKIGRKVGSGELNVMFNKIKAAYSFPGADVPISIQRTDTFLTFGTSIKPGGCIINSGNDISIKLDDAHKSDFPSVGSSWGESEPENIGLTCNPGTNVSITFTASQGSIMNALSNNGTAEGLGVQLLDGKGNVYKLGEETQVITDATTNEQIPVSARYIRTGDMTTGTVDASATYTLNYE
ncbi:fimbrial protein [Citrobacter werkmanii]|uniref:fimbrial protein n=1 Tax=Citrobacter werkmanii TaxID=67827 RepID=UPI0037C7AC63